MLDDRVRAVLARLEEVDAAEREAGLPSKLRARQVSPTTGRFLFALVAGQAGCEVLELGGSRGYSAIWLASAARILGGRVLSVELEPQRAELWRANVAEAGLDEWAELVEMLGVDAAAARIDAPEVKDELRRNTDEAIARAVFGVPTLAIGDELFWGADATQMAIDYVVAESRFADPEFARVATLPVGATRRAAGTKAIRKT